MKRLFGSLTALTAAGFLAIGCGDTTTDQGDSEQRGGSRAGAGGAGPGFDGSTSGTGQYGTVPDSGAANQGKAGNLQTNTAMSSPTNQPKSGPSTPQDQQ